MYSYKVLAGKIDRTAHIIGYLSEWTNKVHQAITVPILPPCIR